MVVDLKIGDKVTVKEWGNGVVVGSCPWCEKGADFPGSENIYKSESGYVWLVKIDETGKIVSTIEEDITLR